MLKKFDFSSKTGILVVEFAFATANSQPPICACADVLHACCNRHALCSMLFAPRWLDGAKQCPVTNTSRGRGDRGIFASGINLLTRWLAWCEIYGAWWKPDIWIPCMVLERSNWGGINQYIELQKHKCDQILQEKHKKLSRQPYSFLREKLRRLRRKTWEDKYFVPQSKHLET